MASNTPGNKCMSMTSAKCPSHHRLTPTILNTRPVHTSPETFYDFIKYMKCDVALFICGEPHSEETFLLLAAYPAIAEHNLNYSTVRNA